MAAPTCRVWASRTGERVKSLTVSSLLHTKQQGGPPGPEAAMCSALLTVARSEHVPLKAGGGAAPAAAPEGAGDAPPAAAAGRQEEASKGVTWSSPPRPPAASTPAPAAMHDGSNPWSATSVLLQVAASNSRVVLPCLFVAFAAGGGERWR